MSTSSIHWIESETDAVEAPPPEVKADGFRKSGNREDAKRQNQ